MEDTPTGEALPEGTILDHYVIQSVLGRGAFGITYLATQQHLGRKVAIKEYLPLGFATRRADSTVVPTQGQDGELFQYGLERMLSEAQTIIQFNHANIVKVLTYFEVNGTAYIVMQYEEGQNLRQHLHSDYPLTEKQLLDIICPIGEGLGLVHKMGFVHRDIKPDNIYLRKDGSPVLLDFGAARNVFNAQGEQLTCVLTEGYAPYEQAAPVWADQGPWTDIYALGATLYFAATGQRAVSASARVNVLEDAQADTYKPLQSLPDCRYSKPFVQAIDWALEFRPADRPQTIDVWTRALTGERTSAVDAGKGRSEAPTRIASPRKAVDSRAQPRGKKWKKAVAAMAGAVAIAGSMALLLKPQDAPAPDPVAVSPVIGIENLVKPALIVAKASGERYIVAKKKEQLIEDMEKRFEHTPERTKFIADLRRQQAEASDGFETGMREYAEMIEQLRSFSPNQVKGALRTVLAEPAFNSERVHAALGEMLASHVTDLSSEAPIWKQDLQALSNNPGMFSR